MADLFDTTVRSALISDCQKYRYWLRRVWAGEGRLLCWTMLNPSTADAVIDDATIKKITKFTRAWGYTGLVVVNLFAYRATKPKNLPKVLADAIGPDNDRHLLEAVTGRNVIAAWGANGSKWPERASQVKKLLHHHAASVCCLKLTNDGQPWHPLIMEDAQQPMEFPA